MGKQVKFVHGFCVFHLKLEVGKLIKFVHGFCVFTGIKKQIWFVHVFFLRFLLEVKSTDQLMIHVL